MWKFNIGRVDTKNWTKFFPTLATNYVHDKQAFGRNFSFDGSIVPFILLTVQIFTEVECAIN